MTVRKQLTRAEKERRGTLQACRDTVRGLDEIRAEIADALAGVAMMRANLTMAVGGIRERGMYVDVVTQNNKGDKVTTVKLNPAFKVQREAQAGLKYWKRALVLLREEQQQAQEAGEPPAEIEKLGRALTADQLAAFLAVSRIVIYKLAKAGRIPSFRIGTCVRFDPKSVANWLRRQ